MQEIECIIKGRVQLVMFRDFVQRSARALDIIGTVENQTDGTVKVIAQGSKDTLDVLISNLKKGPKLSRVDRVSVSWRKPIGAFDSFSIVY